jgi:serine protease Do
VNISETAPGSTVHLKIARNGQTKDAVVSLGEMEEKEDKQASTTDSASALHGVQVDNLTPALAHQLGIAPSSTGVVVTSVDPSSAAASSGLREGDVIQEVNRKPVHSKGEYNEALASSKSQEILLLVNREGTSHFLVVSPQ